MTEEIPTEVLDALEFAREDSSYNMLDRDGVISVLLGHIDDIIGIEPRIEARKAIDWLVENKNRYMEALTAMGERRR